jgi:S1-C subfamily serine protease
MEAHNNMKKLINYLFYLSILLSCVFIISKIISFSHSLIILDDYQLDAKIKSERMLEPVVKITNMVQSDNSTSSSPDGPSISAMSSATGFSIEYNPSTNRSIIITNDHFCNGISKNSILFFQNFQNIRVDMSMSGSHLRILDTIPELDICFLESNGYVKPAIIEDYDYHAMTFEKVYIVGGPSGDFPIIIDTYVSQHLPRKEVSLGSLSKTGNDFLLVSEQIFPGQSGSPIYSEDGVVIGMIFGALQTYGGLGVSHRDIKDAFNSN